MRFDDKLATVLAQPREDAAARIMAWRQIVDILAQTPPGSAAPLPDHARHLMLALRDGVPQTVRGEVAASLAGRRVNPAVIALLSGEKPAVVAPLIGRVLLEEGEWLRLLPALPIAARALLRLRADLSPPVRAGLASFGPSDFALPAPAVAGIAAKDGKSDDASEVTTGQSDATAKPNLSDGRRDVQQEAGRAGAWPGRQETGVEPQALSEAAPPCFSADVAHTVHAGDIAAAAPVSFRFETGSNGMILWVEGVPRAALVGVTIAHAAASPAGGVDGQAAGAFRHRAPFRDARLTVAGGSIASGAWRIAGVPMFDPDDGRFNGYRGTARRPELHEQAAPANGPAATELPADALRQLIHELRTPLNAIVGFGEMIERQVMGPAATPYRTHACAIVEQGQRLLGLVDDLDIAARTDNRHADHGSDTAEPAGLLRGLWHNYRPIAKGLGIALDLTVARNVEAVAADAATLERIFARLLAATIGLGLPGETIAANLSGTGATVVLHLTRPLSLNDRAEAVLLDPGFSPDGDFPGAPLLGLGFALRLVRNLAATIGGTLEVEAERFVLRLPVARQPQVSGAGPA